MESTIRTAIETLLTKLGFSDVNFSVEDSDLQHGDYSSNIALVLYSSRLKEYYNRDERLNLNFQENLRRYGYNFQFNNPRELADGFKEILEKEIPNIDSIDVAGPGFLNFHLSRDFFTKTTKTIIESSETWGDNDSLAGKVYVVEYTDPNPFKAFHIGHLFTNTVGEAIARLMMACSADTKRVCYQGDVGLHVACAIYGMQQLGITAE